MIVLFILSSMAVVFGLCLFFSTFEKKSHQKSENLRLYLAKRELDLLCSLLPEDIQILFPDPKQLEKLKLHCQSELIISYTLR